MVHDLHLALCLKKKDAKLIINEIYSHICDIKVEFMYYATP